MKAPEKGGPLRRGGDEGGGEQIYGRFVESPIFDVNFPHRCEFCLVVTVKVDGGVFEFGFNEIEKHSFVYDLSENEIKAY